MRSVLNQSAEELGRRQVCAGRRAARDRAIGPVGEASMLGRRFTEHGQPLVTRILHDSLHALEDFRPTPLQHSVKAPTIEEKKTCQSRVFILTPRGFLDLTQIPFGQR